MSYESFSLDSIPAQFSGEGTELKPKKGDVYRFSFVALPGLQEGDLKFEDENGNPTAPQIIPVSQMWGGSKVGTFAVLEPRYATAPGVPQEDSQGRPVKPKDRFYTTIVCWPLDRNGKVDLHRIANGEYRVVSYHFTRKKMNHLTAIHREDSPLSKYDVGVRVENDFHDMIFTAKRESILLSLKEKKPEIYQQVIKSAQFVHANMKLPNRYTYEELCNRLSEGSQSQIGSPAQSNFSPSFDADDFLDRELG